MRKFTNAISSIVIADLGCSSGPNAVALVSVAVDAIFRYCALEQQVPPELCVLLNDLPDNDFNNVAKHLVAFQKDAECFGPVLTAIVPGSFYKRLFSNSSVHLAFASNSVHWLSEAPEDLIKGGIPVYDADDDLRKGRRPLVLEAYARQFRKDFTLFLNLRAQELVPGGQMVISLPGYRSNESAGQSNLPWDGIAFMLNDMVSRCAIDREKLDSFYIPMYGPSDKELRKIIEDESSFTINNILAHEVMNDMDRSSNTPKMMALAARAAYEPIIVQHFGATIVEEFERTVELHVRAGTPQLAAAGLVFLSVSLTKKV
ncbi:hypothetical protein HU200_060070 [Digitaria exilis]|uniref:Uncharacterized protein n=1 Tax=Digitaria exilis TaxID=1010633 RepID=A0A835E226_9POAL|nr:hypothetical protein HU200_060070 [Digitaria exilis]